MKNNYPQEAVSKVCCSVIARAIARSNPLINILDCFLLRSSQFAMTENETFETAPFQFALFQKSPLRGRIVRSTESIRGVLLLGLLLGLLSCQDEAPLINLGIENSYKVNRMQKLFLSSEFPGQYKWSRVDAEGKDSVVSVEQNYIFLAEKIGIYYLKLQIIDDGNPVNHSFRVEVTEEDIAYDSHISKVYDYSPAPGQFINVIPEYEEGDTQEDMRRKAEEYISGKNNQLISLGGFGGYVTFGFDHTLVNVPGEFDFKIEGNALGIVEGSSGQGSEPGIVMVSLDKNVNGLPDDEWYELAGSEYYKPETRRNYAITYYKPDPNKVPEYDPKSVFTDTTYIHWKDNYGEEGYMMKNTYHRQDYYPKWISSEQLTFSGTRLADNYVEKDGYFLQSVYDWGYVDNYPNSETEKNSFNIEWAVDADGNPVHLPGVDFIRVYTAINQQCGWLGETSTEISGAEDLHIIEN